MTPLTQLVEAARQGDLDAFGSIVARFQDMAFACAYGMLGDAHLAQDAAQEAFIEAYYQLPRLREPAAFAGWFRRIVFKHGDRIARSRRAGLVPLDAAAEHAGPTDVAALAETRELGRTMRGAVAALPQRERVVTALFYLADYSQAEIAAALDVPLTTVKKRLHDGRRRLRERMADMAHDTAGPRPSHDERFALTVQFLLAVRERDLGRARRLLARDQALVDAREEWSDAERRFYDPMAHGYTALHRAVTNGDVELAELLLARGADVDAATTAGETALHRAVLARRPELVELLLAHGASADHRATRGMTALQRAAITGEVRIAELLLAHGADPNLADERGRTPLHWATIKGSAALRELLLAHGARADMRDETGRTPDEWGSG